MKWLCIIFASCLVFPATCAASDVTMHERQRAAKLASTRVGMPYQHGGAGPRRFDCSGLVVWSYRQVGVDLPRTSHELARHGRFVKRRALRPGDIVFTWDRAFGHAGVYMGKGRYVHAPGAGRKVMIAPLPSGRAYVKGVRIVSRVSSPQE